MPIIRYFVTVGAALSISLYILGAMLGPGTTSVTPSASASAVVADSNGVDPNPPDAPHPASMTTHQTEDAAPTLKASRNARVESPTVNVETESPATALALAPKPEPAAKPRKRAKPRTAVTSERLPEVHVIRNGMFEPYPRGQRREVQQRSGFFIFGSNGW